MRATIWSPGSKSLVNRSLDALARSKAGPASVAKPTNPNGSGGPNDAVWGGDGQYLFAQGGMPDANYITGPTYLLNWGIKTVDKCNHKRVRRLAIGFTEEILRLGRTPREKLRTFTLS